MERLEVEIVGKIAGLEKSLSAAQAKLQKFGEAAERLGTTFSAALTLPIVGLGAASIKAFGDIQALKNGLTAVTGSAGLAEQQFIRLQKIAKLPGLGLNEAVKGAINLQTVGFSADKAEKSMQAFGNAVATVGKGRAEFERAIYGLQQLANTDFPLGEDLNIIKDAIPQVTPLLKEAFGTSRSDEFQKLGITSAQVVDTIISGLSKLPPVTGGINGAFENLGDGVKSNLSEIGESINQAFDISSIIDRFLNSLSSVVSAFKNLSPATQKIIITIAGITAAIGPVILALGVFTTSVIPALTSGLAVLTGAFAAFTGPVILIGAAVAGAVYLIIKNWDTIVSYFTTGAGSQVFETLSNTFGDAIKLIQTLWANFTKYLVDFWNEWGADITSIAKYFLERTLKVFEIVFTVLGGLFKATTAILSGNWSDLGKILLDTTKRVWNGIYSIIVGVVKAGGSIISKLFETLGFAGFTDKLDAFANDIQNKFSFNIPVTVNAKTSDTVPALAGVETATEKTAKAVKKLSEEGAKVTDIYKALNSELQKNTLQFGATRYDIMEDNIKSYQKAIDGLIDQGYKPEAKAIQDLINKQKEYLNLTNLKAKSATFKQTVPKELGAPVMDVSKFDIVSKVTSKLNADFSELTQTILNSGVTDAFAALATSMGSALATGGNLMQTLGSSLLGIIGGIATQLGKAAIGVGIAMIGIKNAFKNPLTAIAAGVALVALGAFISSKVANIPNGGNEPATSRAAPIRPFANGGIVSGPTLGLMGEYAGARSNPEVIAPLNKLKGMLPRTDAESMIILDTKLRGEDLYISGKRVAKRMGGLG